jgi:hypothetical protein
MTLMNETPLSDLNSACSPVPTVPVQAGRSRSGSGVTDLTAVLRQCGPIPGTAAFLGVALDGLPVLLNLRDPTPGPLLIVGDAGSGKRRLLQVVARSADLAHPASGINHAVMTDHPREWEAFGLSPSCEGILTFHHPLTAHYIGSLAQSARTGVSSRPFLLLIVDGLEALASDPETRDSMLWLLENGPSNSIWPIVAVSTPRTSALAEWLKPFSTVLCGRNSGVPTQLEAGKPAFDGSRTLTSGTQFALLSGDEWLPFWVPEPL